MLRSRLVVLGRGGVGVRRRRGVSMRGRLVVVLVCLGLVGSLFGGAGVSPVLAQDDVGGSGVGFADVDGGSVHAEAIRSLADAGLFEGTLCDGGFCPGDGVERWVMAVWLVRVLDGVDPVGSGSRFADVDDEVWWAPFVERLAVLGVTQGCDTDPLRFCPQSVVKRGQMASFLVRAFGWSSAASGGFADTEGSVHEANVDVLAAEGVTRGCDTDPLRFCPQSVVKRGQMASFLVRASGLLDGPFEVLARVDGAVLSVGSNVGFDADDVTMRVVDGLVDEADGVVAGVGVELTSDVEFDGSFLLTLDLPPPPEEDAIPLVLHYGDDGEVDVRLGLWDEDAGTVTVAVDEFSRWGAAWNAVTAPGRWVWRGGKFVVEKTVAATVTVGKWVVGGVRWFVDMLDDAIDGLTGRTDPPDPCYKRLVRGSEDVAWLDGNLSAVHECLESGGSDVAEVTIKSNRRYIQLVTTPPEARDVDVGLLGDWADNVADLVGKIEPVKPNSYALFGDTGMSYDLSTRVGGMFPLYAYQAYSLDVVSFFLKLLLNGVEEMLGKIFGPVIVEVGKCVVGSPGANSAGFDRFKDALNCIAKNLTINNMKKHYGKVWELADAAIRNLLRKLPGTFGRLATGPWADVTISLFDAINDRLNPGSQNIHITGSPDTTPPPPLGAGAISAGGTHSCGIRSDGAAVCWGARREPLDYGQTNPPDSGPFTAVSAGEFHTCGVRTSGAIACWGYNRGYGSGFGPVDAPPGTFTAISAGQWHSCGIRSDGAAVCWGGNELGQVDAPPGTFTAISAGGWHSCGIRSDGAVVCWGARYKQGVDPRLDYGQVDAPPGTFIAISVGWLHSCGIRADGAVVCWGNNAHGQVDAPSGAFTAISADGYAHSCGIRADGAVVCWGWNDYGQVDAPSGTFIAISAGWSHSCGIRADGTAVCWGSNQHGRLNAPSGSFIQDEREQRAFV